MEVVGRILFVFILATMLLHYYSSNVEGRNHYHKKQKKKGSSGSPSTPPPSPVNPPSIPSDPYPTDPGNSSDGIFNVMDLGAVGDGCTDDTAAFRDAWKAACAVESAVLLAPADKVFVITSTIFSGPCKPGLVFQVRIQIQTS